METGVAVAARLRAHRDLEAGLDDLETRCGGRRTLKFGAGDPGSRIVGERGRSGSVMTLSRT
ncbi:hypothetical protein A5755_02795 [Mycolicibacterium fortuitum]|nr:hypothetical protein ATO49_28175 [Mycolicibacterium fortuitum subsp. fortuitum DSM 46621 = ATCC 6841 = JCM 6387]OBB01612.1 hypothetical protein A5668_23595 [Mycolicibacterium fortuitum]OBB22755.1 hypothetical protein A5763_22035 [Mycolicibacterium fortuitum]OBB42367.1 hypothetical protein A5754_14785 [Mycolicibacterium fortuitum]OBB62986.1 hypothetical protein A5755_02795 [Mycolicibacterium fortuitum]